MTPVVGNAAAQGAFASAMAGALHHAWLIAGPQGVGKARFAKAMALALMGGNARARSLIEARSHPDYRLIEREIWVPNAKPPRVMPYDERKGDEPISRGIRIAQIRDLQRLFVRSPSIAAWRVVIIDAIDDLEREGANALLKSLEEPPVGTVFLLISHSPGRLLPTIRSRCRLLRFGLLHDAEMATALREADPTLDGDELAALVAAGEGSPGRALRFAGLDVTALDATIAAIARDGDRDNARRSTLARALSGKAAQPRYEAFLERVPAYIARAARQWTGPALARGLDAHARARDLGGSALGLSLDPQATVWEMAGVLAGLPR